MLNRRHVVALATLIITLLMAGPALAQTAKKYTVFPFKYNGPKKYSYFPKAFQASLYSDLEWIGKVEPASDSTIAGLKAPANKADALSVLKGSGLDYCVTGDIAIIEKQATVSLKAYGTDGTFWQKKEQLPINEIAPWLDEQGRAIQGDVFNRPGYGSTEETPAAKVVEQKAPINSDIVMATEDRYKADTLNPQFRYEGGAGSDGRWRSQTFRFFSSSMVVGDGTGDGVNEVFLLDDTHLRALRYQEGRLVILDSFKLPSNRTSLRLELVDLNRDGAQELIVATYKPIYNDNRDAEDGLPFSHIFSFKEGKIKQLVRNYTKYLGALRMPPTYTPVMVQQSKGRRHLFDGPINEAYLKDGEVVAGQRISTPEFGGIFNMIYLPDDFSYRYVVLDDFRRMKVYSQTMERLYSSENDRYNTSAVGLEFAEVKPGLSSSKGDGKIEPFNVPFRMLAASLTKKGKYELLANKDISIASQVFDRFTYFSQGEIHSLMWDGVGMNLAWKTRRIKGQVADMALADLNGDGKRQLVVLVNTFPGTISLEKRKTVVLAYDLNID